MARHDILKNPVKIDNYTLVFKQLDRYQTELKNSKHPQHFQELDILIEQLQPFRTKKGGLKKTAIRTNKGRREFNKIIKHAKQEARISAKYRKEVNKLIIERKIAKLKADNEELKIRKNSLNEFATLMQTPNPMSDYITKSEWYVIRDEATMEFGLTAKEVVDIMDMAVTRLEMETPQTSMLEGEDKKYKQVADVLNKLKNTKNVRKEEVFDLLKQAINIYVEGK